MKRVKNLLRRRTQRETSLKSPHQTREQGEGEEGKKTKKAQAEGKTSIWWVIRHDAWLSNVAVRKGHVYDVEPSNSLDLGEYDPTYECEEVDHKNKQIEAKEEIAIRQPVKVAQKRNKPLLQSKGDSTTLVLGKPTSSGKELPIVREELVLKSKEGSSKKRTYQKEFIIRMSTRSFLSLVAQLNKAQAEVVKSMGFASFLKVDLKNIPGKFSNCLVESFDPYAVCFRLPDGQKFPVTAFAVYATLGVPLRGTKIIEITKSSTEEEYD